MKIICNRSVLHEALQHVGRVVSGHTPQPILNNVLLEVAGNSLRIVGYDMEIGAQSEVPAEAGEEGALTVPARQLVELVAGLPDATIELTDEDRSVLGLTCGSSRYRILGLPAKDYPVLPKVESETGFTAPQALMKGLIQSTVFAASGDETRAILTGVLLKWESGTLRMVATDSYRLAVKTAAAGEVVPLGGEQQQDWEVIVPARALQELNRLLDAADEDTQLEVRVGEQQIVFAVGPYTLVARLIEGQFPNYARVIPSAAERTITVAREPLLAAIRRAAIVARTEASKLVFQASGGTLTIKAESGDVGRAHEELAASVEGEEIEIAFSAEYLTDVLGVMNSEAVVWQFTGPLDKSLLKGADDPDYLYVVMPMQL